MFERNESTGCFTLIVLYILFWFVSMLFSLWLWNWIMVDIFQSPHPFFLADVWRKAVSQLYYAY
jgi:hypothetical protein